MAVAMGAKVVERHFTLDKTMKGADHKASLDETELKTLIEKIRLFEKVRGIGEKKFLDNEKNCFKKLSKSIVYKSNFKKGTKLTEEHITTKSSLQLGVSPLKYYDILGKTLNTENFGCL